MQKARRHPVGLRPLVGARFQVFSPPCAGYFSPFLHSTCSLSVSRKYLALPDGAGRFRQDSSGPALLRILNPLTSLLIQDSHLLWFAFPNNSDSSVSFCQVLQPSDTLYPSLGFFPFARHYLGNHFCFLFLRVLRCFSSPSSPLLRGTISSIWWVAPFGHLRINARCNSPQLFAAYHVLLRLREPRHPPCALIHFIALSPFFTV